MTWRMLAIQVSACVSTVEQSTHDQHWKPPAMWRDTRRENGIVKEIVLRVETQSSFKCCSNSSSAELGIGCSLRAALFTATQGMSVLEMFMALSYERPCGLEAWLVAGAGQTYKESHCMSGSSRPMAAQGLGVACFSELQRGEPLSKQGVHDSHALLRCILSNRMPCRAGAMCNP